MQQLCCGRLGVTEIVQSFVSGAGEKRKFRRVSLELFSFFKDIANSRGGLETETGIRNHQAMKNLNWGLVKISSDPKG